MITNRNTLKEWFSQGKKPLAAHFAALIDSYWHNNDEIPAEKIAGLLEALEAKADNESITNLAQVVVQLLQQHNQDSTAHSDIRTLLQKLPTVKQTAAAFNASSVNSSRYVVITDSGTISMDANFFGRVTREVLFYVKCNGQILISNGYRPEDAYAAASVNSVRELSVYVDIDGTPIVTVFEKPLKNA